MSQSLKKLFINENGKDIIIKISDKMDEISLSICINQSVSNGHISEWIITKKEFDELYILMNEYKRINK